MTDQVTNASGPEHLPFRLGKKPAEPGKIKFKLASYVDLDLPKPPEHFRHPTPPPWREYANSQYGNCVWVGAANETRLWEREGGIGTPMFTSKTVLSDYAAVTGFRLDDPNTDQGTSMPDAASYRRHTGVLDARGNRHKVDAYAALRLRDEKYLRAALWVLGGLGVGMIFYDYNMRQFDEGKPWDWEEGGRQEGGHYIPAVGIAPSGNIVCVSWGREVEMTMEFYMRAVDEVIAYIDLDRINRNTRLSPEGFNGDRLMHDLGLVADGKVYKLDSNREA